VDIIFRIGGVILLVLLNAFFVASEYSLVSIRRTRVDELARKGNVTAKLLQKALDNLSMYISSTQLGVTFASLALGWIGEPAVANYLEPEFGFLPHTAALITSHSVAVIIAFALITYLQTVLGELAPKSIALQRSEGISRVIITPIMIFTRIFKPFIWLLNISGQFILKMFGIHAPTGHQLIYSEEEIKTLLSQSSKGGAIPEKEVEMVYNVFQLGDIPVKLIMIPRTEILAFNIETTIGQIIEAIVGYPHSRFPVYKNSIDNVVGFVHVKDIYKKHLSVGKEIKLSDLEIIREILSVPEVKKIDAVLQDMRKKRIHIAIVNDEFGGTSGLVSLEDIIESLVGEIEDEFDKPVKDIAKEKDGSYIIEGHTSIQEVQDKFNFPLKGQGYTTMGGLVFGLLGHIPHVGNSVQIGDFILKVEELDGKRIKLIRLRKQPPGTMITTP